jgi:hypothetical protein
MWNLVARHKWSSGPPTGFLTIANKPAYCRIAGLALSHATAAAASLTADVVAAQGDAASAAADVVAAEGDASAGTGGGGRGWRGVNEMGD